LAKRGLTCWRSHLFREEFYSAPVHSPPPLVASSVCQGTACRTRTTPHPSRAGGQWASSPRREPGQRSSRTDEGIAVTTASRSSRHAQSASQGTRWNTASSTLSCATRRRSRGEGFDLLTIRLCRSGGLRIERQMRKRRSVLTHFILYIYKSTKHEKRA
jgi:hypothetical protein